MAQLTPEQIEEFLQEFFDVVGTRQYIGARYVPLFGRKGESTIEWDNSAPYEPMTVVLHEGDSFTSRQYVPAGIDIDNGDYWAETGNFNAQIEAYREEVLALAEEVDDFQDALNGLVSPFLEGVEYGERSFTGTLNNTTLVHYAKIPSTYKPHLRMANDQINSTQLDVDAALANKAVVQVNAGIFNTTTGLTEGVVLVDGVVEKDSVTLLDDRTNIYMRENGTLDYTTSDVTASQLKNTYDAVWGVTSFYPIIEGGVFTATERTENDFQPRTLIAQDFDGNYCVVVCSGRQQHNQGMSLFDLRDFLVAIGFNAKFAYNLDGGASSSLCVMGIRANQLTDNNERPVSSFISFEADESEEMDFMFAMSNVASKFIIRNSKTYSRIYSSTLYNYVTGDDSFVRGVISVDKSTADYQYKTCLLENFQQSNGLYRLQSKLTSQTASDPYNNMLTLNSQYKEGALFGVRIGVHTRDQLLAWGAHARNTSHSTPSDLTRNYVHLKGVMQQSGNNVFVDFYQYNFGDGMSGSKSFHGYAVMPDGKFQDVTLTYDPANHTVTFDYSDTSVSAISLQSLYGMDWY